MNDCGRIMAAGGFAYSTEGGCLIAIPVDGEWITAKAATLKEAFDSAIESDGKQIDDGDRMATPHLDMGDALDQLTEWSQGSMTRIVGTAAASA